MTSKHTTCYWCIHKDTVECPLVYVEAGEPLGNYYEVDPTTFYCAKAEDDSGFRQRPI